MTGKASEIDIVMAIENIGNELKRVNENLDGIWRDHYDVLNAISGSLEILVSKMGHGLE